MSEGSSNPAKTGVRPKRPHRLRRYCAWGCGLLVLMLVGVIALALLLLNRVPKTYPPVTDPIRAPNVNSKLGGGLDGFASPYLGHTGSWDGKGGGIFGTSKIPDLEVERAMGLRWTFMPVHWRAMEPDGPVNLARDTPAAWRALDAFVIAAHERGLNILMQAPVVGGNAGGPPKWASRREPGKSASANMEAAADFAAKLASRYSPRGTLARNQGWTGYGVRAWELDNEPESYRTSWKGQAGDYAEFVTKAAARIKQVDPQVLILTPAIAGGGHALKWVAKALDAQGLAGSPAFRHNGVPYSIGRPTDVVSFHCYEGLETAFSKDGWTIERDFDDLRSVFQKWEKQSPQFSYDRKEEYWQTEGNYDFLGVLSKERRAAWRFQFFTRAFAAGIRKVMVMDASKPEQSAVRAYVRVLPNPFPMLLATKEISIAHGQAVAFIHADSTESNARRVWIVWALAGTGDAIVDIPARAESAQIVFLDGHSEKVDATSQRIRLKLKGDLKMPPPVLVVETPASRGR
ncbi:MAG TPA: hypothetical protein VG146_05400 [Verrucomicrobiae bacterium]|nr:hypothetical protein [Verrucomicrobiae bacterium]